MARTQGNPQPGESPDIVSALLAALNDIGSVLSGDGAEESFLKEVVDRLPGALGMPYGAVIFYDGTQSVIAASSSPDTIPHPFAGTVEYVDCVLQGKEGLDVRVLVDDDGEQAFGSDLLKTLVIVPLATQGAPLGAVLLGDDAKRPMLAVETGCLRIAGQLISAGLREIRLQIKLNAATRQLAAQSERLYQSSVMDPLTGLGNRQFMLDEASHEVSEAITNGLPLSLLVIDVDHLNAINDRYGIQFGDNVLCRIAEVIRESVRGRDIAARYEGDQFTVVLPSTAGPGAVVVAERLRERVTALKFFGEDSTSYLTVSIGVASLSNSASSLDQLIVKAEECFYQAKLLGGNQIVFDWDEALQTLAEV